MVLRELERQPLRTLLSSLGIAAAIAILVVGRISQDAFEQSSTCSSSGPGART